MPVTRLAAAAVPSPLLAPDEPPPAELFNAEMLDRPGDRPVLFVCDHAGRRVPRALGDLGLDATAFERHIAWDIGAADCARHLARTFAAPLVLATYSRLVIDPNRQTEDPTSVPEASDETPVPANAGISPVDRASRIAALHVPYHAVVDDGGFGTERALGGLGPWRARSRRHDPLHQVTSDSSKQTVNFSVACSVAPAACAVRSR